MLLRKEEKQSCQIEVPPKHMVVLHISHMHCHSPAEVSNFSDFPPATKNL